MRPVKKSLKRLGDGQDRMTTDEQGDCTRRCLLKIGDHINDILKEMTLLLEIRQWRSNLWHFVSKFTEFDAKKLHKVYKHMSKKREQQLDPANESSQVWFYLI